MVAPIIPGLNDSEVPAILLAVKEDGVSFASYVLLRLPLTVRPVFLDWLGRTEPDKKSKIESLIRSTRDGDLSTARFGERMRGTGELSEQIKRMFRVFARRYGLDKKPTPLDVTIFRPPQPTSGQRRLF